MKILQIVIIVVSFFVWILPNHALAKTETLNQFVNIVNPVRISAYTKDPKASIASQYFEVTKRNLPATWLFTYDAIQNDGVRSIANTMDRNQELGLFLEVTPLFARDAGVIYNQTDSWHRSNSLFLSGYTQDDREKLIDQVFNKFREKFGFYPVSVGSWWIDSFSLEYMKNKYGVIANLTCADQFETDGYHIWGQYWSTPFFPSRYHAGMPANDINSKLDLVTIQWAERDPLNGYGKGPASLFSTQDYFDIDYFQELVRFYAEKHSNSFGQITIGLEGDFTQETYAGTFARQLDFVLDMKNKGLVDVVTMKDFAGWYRNSFPTISPSQILETEDFLGKKIKAIWYQSPFLRAHLTYNYETYETKFLDLRFYFNNFEEPYYVSPNRDLDLFINIPSIIDSASDEKEAWVVLKKKLEEINVNGSDLVLKYQDGALIKLSKDNLTFSGKINQIPKALTHTPAAKINKQDNLFLISPVKSWIFSQDGLVFRDLTPEATNFLRQKRIMVAEAIILLIFTTALFFILKRDSSKKKRLFSAITISSIIFGIFFLYNSNTRNYFVSQSELDALIRLSLMPDGKIVVFDRVCLQCSFHTKYLPAVFSNKRSYVPNVSKKKVVYNSSVFTAKTREEARKELVKLEANYIYAVRYEDYKEIVPFSPGDLNLEEIYSNANVIIWRIRKN
ncbi:MAG: hypothetical protein PHE48_01885 [Candidatus Daviesbacteria bacterium]|nr:hypothetical protein [Candidatus Daviesbacteria bacterium]